MVPQDNGPYTCNFPLWSNRPHLLWFKARGSIQLKRPVCLSMCTMTEGHYAVTVIHFSKQLGPGKTPGTGVGAKPPEGLRTLHFTVPEKEAKNRAKSTIILWCIFTSPVNLCNTSYEF